MKVTFELKSKRDYMWNQNLKLSISVSLLVSLVIMTVATMHSRTKKVNRMSLLVYYAIIGEAIFMCAYYTVFNNFERG